MRRLVSALILVSSVANAGTLTNKAELELFRDDPSKASLKSQMIAAGDFVSSATVSGVGVGSGGNCVIGGTSGYLQTASDALAQATASVLSGNNTWATDARAQVLELTDTTFPDTPSGGYECTLTLSFHLPVWVETAQLLEEMGLFSAADKTAFQTWLKSVYRHPAWASRVRRNNWGASGSLTAYLIASYLPANAVLTEVSPGPSSITASAALTAHLDQQLDRIATVEEMDSDCAIWGIQSHGGIPDELRRGSTGCEEDHLLADDDGSITYQTLHADFLLFHALARWRVFKTDLFEANSQALLKAVTFVIDNPEGSFDYPDDRWGGLTIASNYYENSAVDTAVTTPPTFRGGIYVPYMRIFGPFQRQTSGQCP